MTSKELRERINDIRYNYSINCELGIEGDIESELIKLEIDLSEILEIIEMIRKAPSSMDQLCTDSHWTLSVQFNYQDGLKIKKFLYENNECFRDGEMNKEELK